MPEHVQAVHFMRGLATHLQHDTYRANPQNLQAAILAARQAEIAARRSGKMNVAAQVPSKADRRPSKPKNKAQNKGKFKNNIPNNSRPFAGTCYNCGRQGHKAADCRVKTQPSKTNAGGSSNNKGKF